jgi:hypothetical protein
MKTPEKKPWKRAAATISALFLAGLLIKDDAPVSDTPNKARKGMEITYNDRSYVLRDADVDHMFRVPCCQIAVMTNASKAMEEITGFITSGGAIASDTGITLMAPFTGKKSGSTLAFSIVTHPRSSTFMGFLRDDDCDEITDRRLERLLIPRNFNESAVLERLKRATLSRLSPEKNDVISNYHVIKRSGHADIAEVYLGSVSEQCGVFIASKARTGDNYHGIAFNNLLLHEAMHGSIIKSGHSIPYLPHEMFSVLAEIAYGENPVVGLRHFVGFSPPLDMLRIERMGGLNRNPSEFLKSQYYESKLGRMKAILGVRSVLGLLTVDDESLRRAATTIMDEMSQHHFSRPIDAIVSPFAMRSLIAQGRAYLGQD